MNTKNILNLSKKINRILSKELTDAELTMMKDRLWRQLPQNDVGEMIMGLIGDNEWERAKEVIGDYKKNPTFFQEWEKWISKVEKFVDQQLKNKEKKGE